MPKINSLWLVMELRDNPVKNNCIMRMKFKSKVSKDYMCVFFGGVIINTLEIVVLDGYSDMSNKRTLCEL